MAGTKKNRCTWAGTDQQMIDYHDQEWGVPVHDDIRLFEFLILEGAQAGLSWQTILNKRNGYREVFAGFDPEIVALFTSAEEELFMKNPAIVRNRLKISSTISNARVFRAIQQEFGSFDSFIWHFVNGKPIQNSWNSLHDIPAQTPLSEVVSKELKKHGFRFVGPTICYAFMQAVGMVNDHTVDCFRYHQLIR